VKIASPAHRLLVRGDVFGEWIRQEVRHQDHAAKGLRAAVATSSSTFRARRRLGTSSNGLIYGVHNWICGPKRTCRADDPEPQRPAFTLSKKLVTQGGNRWRFGSSDPRARGADTRSPRLFPTGTRDAMWIYYWLAAHGNPPVPGVEAIVVPNRSPQMLSTISSRHWTASSSASLELTAPSGTDRLQPPHPRRILERTIPRRARTTRRVFCRREISQHRARHDRRRALSRQVDRRSPRQPARRPPRSCPTSVRELL